MPPAAPYARPTYTARSRQHIWNRAHAANSTPRSGQSRFLPTEGGQKFTDEIIAKSGPPSIQPDGRAVYSVADLGRVVGYGRRGQPARGGKVVVEGPSPSPRSPFVYNEVVTQFPL